MTPETDTQTAVSRNDPLWYKDAVIYQLHIKAFYDANNDGIGDFAGLTQKLDYLVDLGVTAVWLLPFYPSPLRDDGYDIADYTNVNPAYGTLDDFRIFVAEAHKRGLRVITELVINHTSDQHSWFQRARNAPAGSPERDYYVWSDDDKKYEGTRIIFSDTEKSNWTWDPVANAYYWHRFFSHQPDLNFDNPEVLRQVIEVMYFWLDMGVDGLRLDAVPYLCEREGTNNENLPETHAILKQIRAALETRYPDRMLLAEANQWPEDVLPYFGDNDECHMAFHFPLMPRMYMAVAQADRHPITDIMYQTPAIPADCQWALFLRNHDELTLEMVSDRERDYLWNFYATDKRARINFGIRRRLAPLLDNDRRKIELLNSLLLSMPGTPVVYYGDELRMGDNIYLGDRDGVRTPMQWSSDRNGGFSRADPAKLYLPSIMDPVFGYQSVNVEAQMRERYSLLNWMRSMIAVVKSTQIFGRGGARFLSPVNRAILAYLREHEGQTILCVANFARSAQAVELSLRDFKGLVPVEMLGQTRFPAIGELPYLLTLPPYGFYWFMLSPPEGTEAALSAMPELVTLVMARGWDSLLAGEARGTLEKNLLPVFLMTRRWYKSKHAAPPEVKIVQATEVGEDRRLVLIEATAPGEPPRLYIMALGIDWDKSFDDDPLTRIGRDAISMVRRFNQIGVLYEASQQPDLVQKTLAHLRDNPQGSALAMEIVGDVADMADLPVRILGAEQTNSSALLGNKYVLKFIRQPLPGQGLEEEFARHLTQTVDFPRAPKLAAAIRMAQSEGDALTIGLAHEAVRNQGDGWKVTLTYLENYTGGVGAALADDHQEEAVEDDYYDRLAHQLGVRTGELHRALMTRTGNAGFDPEPVTAADRARWAEEASAMLARVCGNLEKLHASLPEATRKAVDRFLKGRGGLEEKLRTLLPDGIRTPKIRVHGDYHLGQVLVSDNDFYIIDFEGEPGRELEQRRQKHSPFKDVAGMIRSFDYAGAASLRAANLLSDEKRAKIAPLLKQWRQKAETAFLAGYQAAIQFDDTPETQAALLRFFKLEKALYEVAYESEHRPDWLDIPLTSMLETMQEDDT